MPPNTCLRQPPEHDVLSSACARAELPLALGQSILRALGGDVELAVGLVNRLDSRYADAVPLPPAFHGDSVFAADRPAEKASLPERRATDVVESAFNNRDVSREAGEFTANVVTKRGLLLGVIRSDLRGGLFLCDPAVRHDDAPTGADTRIVIAPPPSPALRCALVWVKDWRRLPVSSWDPESARCSHLYETRVADLVVLREGPCAAPSARANFVPVASLKNAPAGILNVSGWVRCKSPVLSGRSPKPAFIVELGSAADCAPGSYFGVFVIFSGRQAVRWWPFVHEMCFLSFSHLSLANVPSIGNITVLRASNPATTAFGLPGSLSSSAAPATSVRSRSRLCENERCPSKKPVPVESSMTPGRVQVGDKRKRSHRQLSRCCMSKYASYVGEITKIMKDGRIILDSRVVLYPGIDCSWYAGPKAQSFCFRERSRIQVTHVIVERCSFHRIALFPTVRTSAHLLHFGELTAEWVRCPQAGYRQGRSNRWRHLWTELNPRQVCWAEEVFLSLAAKFGPWVCKRSPASGSKIAPCEPWLLRETMDEDETMLNLMFGSRPGERGLLKHVMALNGFPEMVHDVKRDIYREFMSWQAHDCTLQTDIVQHERFVFAPQLRDVSNALEFLAMKAYPTPWCQTLDLDADEKETNSKNVRYVECAMFMDDLIFGALAEQRRELEYYEETERSSVLTGVSCLAESLEDAGDFGLLLKARRDGDMESRRICLAGMLESSMNFDGTLQLTDATGSISVAVVGCMPPTMLGAIVQVDGFGGVVEINRAKSARRHVLFNADHLKIIVEGPYSVAGLKASDGSNVQDLTAFFSLPPTDWEGGSTDSGFGGRPNGIISPQSVNPVPSLMVPHDSRPVIAFFVMGKTLVADGQQIGNGTKGETSLDEKPSFALRGVFIAFRRDRAIEHWTALGDLVSGYVFGVIAMEGKFCTALHPFIHPNHLYAISIPDVAHDVEDFRKRIWTVPAALVGKSQKLEFILERVGRWPPPIFTLSANAGRLWLQHLHDGRGMRCDNETFASADESDMEEAVTFLRQVLSSHSNLDDDYFEQFALDSPKKFKKKRETRNLSLNGVVLMIRDLSEQEISCVSDGNKISFCSIVRVRSAFLPFMTADLAVFSGICVPGSIVPGTAVRVQDAIWLFDEELGVPRLCLGHNSFIKAVNVASSSPLVTPFPCCHRPLIVGEVIDSSFPMNLWDFSRAVRNEALTKRLTVGHVSLAIQDVTYINLWKRRRAKGEPVCKTCGSAEWVILADASVNVDDGTTNGKVIVSEFRVVLEVLRTSNEESLQLQDAVIRHGLISYRAVASGGEVGAAKTTSFSTPGSVQQAFAFLGALARRSCRPVVAVLGSGTAVDLNRKDQYDSAIRVNGDVQVGPGLKLFTAVADHRHKAIALCYAIFEHRMNGRQQRQACPEHNTNSSLTQSRIRSRFRSRETEILT